FAETLSRQAYVAARLGPNSESSGRGEGLARSLRVAAAGAGARRRRFLDEMIADSDEETNDPLVADVRNFYKVEKWTRDGMKVDRLLYAGNSLDKARDVFTKAIKHRPRIRLTLRQRTRALDEWPQK